MMNKKQSIESSISTNESQKQSRWVPLPPPRNQIKINVDAATNLKNSKGAIAVVVRDEAGNLLTGMTRQIFCCSPLEAEAQAVKLALNLAESLEMSEISIETDNEEVRDSCYNSYCHWSIRSCIHEIKQLLSRNPLFTVKWIRRSANKVADLVAKLSLKGNLPSTWTCSLRLELRRPFSKINLPATLLILCVDCGCCVFSHHPHECVAL